MSLVGISDADINDIDNSSVTSESQSIDINSRNLNNNVSNDCDSPSIEVHNTPMLNTTLDNHLDSGNILRIKYIYTLGTIYVNCKLKLLGKHVNLLRVSYKYNMSYNSFAGRSSIWLFNCLAVCILLFKRYI